MGLLRSARAAVLNLCGGSYLRSKFLPANEDRPGWATGIAVAGGAGAFLVKVDALFQFAPQLAPGPEGRAAMAAAGERRFREGSVEREGARLARCACERWHCESP